LHAEVLLVPHCFVRCALARGASYGFYPAVHDDAYAIAAAVRCGSRRAADVVNDALARAAADRSNAIVTICEAAAERDAADVDHMIVRGNDPGPLAGVPFTVKDTIATAGSAQPQAAGCTRITYRPKTRRASRRCGPRVRC